MSTATPFDQEGFGQFVQAAFTGPNAFLFIALDVMALIAYRRGAAWAFWLAAAVAAVIGGLSTLIEMQAVVGAIQEPTRLLHAVLTGMIVSGSSALVIGYSLVFLIHQLGWRKIETMLPPGNGPASNGGKS